MPQYLEKTPEEWLELLNKKPFNEIYLQRELPGADQNYLAPIEHRAFAREVVRDNPLMAGSLAVATPLYEIAKLLGLKQARSKPSFRSLGQGFVGIGEGLMQGLGGYNEP